jgi:aerobic-type carbon monoxide dehydrogenase small subunit (CoxS/CutS family)
MELTINGARYTVDAAPGRPLVYLLRDDLGLTGTKFGCGAGHCGACTVLLDDRPVRSCQTAVGTIGEARITTIEGLAQGEALHPVQAAWIAEQVPQCGYCQPGMIMSTVGLLRANPTPDDTAINEALAGNLCRCGTYVRIRRAIRRASEQGQA